MKSSSSKTTMVRQRLDSLKLQLHVTTNFVRVLEDINLRESSGHTDLWMNLKIFVLFESHDIYR